VTRPPRRTPPWLILALLLSAVTINYIDRGSLSVAAPSMAHEFALSEAQRGWLFSAFFWTYSFSQIAAGVLADRYGVKYVYAGGFLIWSVATSTTGFLSSFSGLLACRLLLGIGESITYPGSASLLARHFSEEQRGFANGLVDAGSKIGPALSTLVGGLLVDQYGWRALFLVIGFGSLLWLVPWLSLIPNDRSPDDAAPQPSPGMLTILKRREAWGTSLGMFALGYVWTLLISWLPTYLVEHRGLSTRAMAWAGSLPFWGMALTSITGGWLSDMWIARGNGPTLVRKGFVVTGLLLCALLLIPVDLVSHAAVSVGLLVAASLSLGIFTSNVWAITQTLAGPTAAGKWAGIQNCVGNLGGVVAPALTGIIVQKTGSFFLAFATASAVLGLAIIVYLTTIGQIKPLNWPASSDDPARRAGRRGLDALKP
jgi:MFS family permease